MPTLILCLLVELGRMTLQILAALIHFALAIWDWGRSRSRR